MLLEITQDKLPQVDDFVHLHLHTIYSTLDGMCKLEPLMERAKELGMKSIAISDHNHTGGSLTFQKAAKKAGLKPILGAELYFNPQAKTIAKPAEYRNALCVRDIFKNKSEFVIEIADRKRDEKTFEEYRQMLINILEKDNRTFPDQLIPEDVKKVFTDKQINKIKKDNKKLTEKYECDTTQYHLILLAMNQQGWNNLIKIQSIASEQCTYNGRFITDFELLEKYSEGIICTTACIGSMFSKLIQRRRFEEAESLILKFARIFENRFYLEIQPLIVPQQISTNEFYLKMHQKHGIPAVATSDVHYIFKEDWDDHDTFLCISTGRLKDEKLDKDIYIKTHKKDPEGKGFRSRMRYTNDFWLRSKEEMTEAFMEQESASDTFYKNQEDNPYHTEEYRNFWISAMNNTVKIAAQISDDILIGSKETLYPIVKNLPPGMSSDEVLYSEALRGLIEYDKKMRLHGEQIDFWKYYDKIIDEMSVISAKHYSDYFLGVQEYVNWANSIDPETGMPRASTACGRGSAASSLILNLIGITKNIDPIKSDLMFSRFLTIDRNSPPDYYNSRATWKQVA